MSGTAAPPVIRTLFSEQAIAARITELSDEIAASEPNRLFVVAILKGSFVFAADLMRGLHRAGLAPEIEFMTLSSYHEETVSSGAVKILHDVESDVTGRAVLIIDDILESGRTLAFARDLLAGRGAQSVELCVLLDKPARREAEVSADYIGFECPDEFVVGYGMDLAHGYRQLPFIGVLEQA